MKLIVACASALFLAFAPTLARACTADIELVSSEFAGKDVLNTFRLSHKGDGVVALSFDATTVYRSGGKTLTQTSSYSESLSDAERLVTEPEATAAEVDEIAAVKITNVHCTP